MKKIFVRFTLVFCVMIFAATGSAFGAEKESYGFDFSRSSCMEKFFELLNVKPAGIEKLEDFINCTLKNNCDKEENEAPDTEMKPDTENNNNNNSNNNNNNENNSAGDSSNDIAGISSQAKQVANLVNEERKEAGLSPLTMNSSLSKVAQAKAEDMRDNNYFSHTSPVYGSPFEMLKQFGIKYTAAGENIAKGQKSAESVMNAWMNSSGHRANILNNDYTQIGVGYCTDGNGNTYWVQMFIR